ncbi:hypothetical protein FPOAC2_10380 [Fusarium poae]|uniref:uncharacterized protein n=1 Tax=Fusarium poae TaxID=36050 RepID=UPI001D04A649|nr:uncharacterized protein FPOAC1_013457 [Fusarium poae]KAG8664677.1 hypothetical protein FPOAC1_013457 [Fusarium poae]
MAAIFQDDSLVEKHLNTALLMYIKHIVSSSHPNDAAVDKSAIDPSPNPQTVRQYLNGWHTPDIALRDRYRQLHEEYDEATKSYDESVNQTNNRIATVPSQAVSSTDSPRGQNGIVPNKHRDPRVWMSIRESLSSARMEALEEWSVELIVALDINFILLRVYHRGMPASWMEEALLTTLSDYP